MTIINSVIKGKQPVIDTLNVTPTTSAQQITAPSGTDGYSPVNISAVTSSIDANIVAGNIKKDVQILGVTGSYEGTTPTGTKTITSNGTHDVTNYASADVQVPTTAPERYIQYAVNSNHELIHDTTVTSIMNLNGVTRLGNNILQYAYNGCTNITGNIDLSGITYVGTQSLAYAFSGCTGITSVKLSNNMNVQSYGFQYAFSGCTGITSIDFNGLTVLSGFSWTFSGCTGLTSVDIPTLQRSDNQSQGTFSGCTNITSVSLPSFRMSGAVCGDWFSSCSNLSSVSLPKLCFLNSFNNWFKDCVSLQSLDLSSIITCNSGNGHANYLCSGCINLTSVDISNMVKLTNMSYAFQNCTSLTSLSFNSFAYNSQANNSWFSNMLQGVTGCTVHFPAEWQTDMANWSNVINGFGGTNTTVLFDLPTVLSLDVSKITDVVFRDGFSNAFAGCTHITDIRLSNLVQISGSTGCGYLCSGDTALTTAVFDSLKTVNGGSSLYYAFRNCTSLSQVKFPALKNVNNYEFSNMLQGVTGCTVHFPSNSTASSNSFGGTNITVVKDLPAVVILTCANTVEYERNPKNDTSTALAWRINGTMPDVATTYYTSGTSDPQVGDTIYSDDTCTTAVTTINSIA